jgi:hypothetical protein
MESAFRPGESPIAQSRWPRSAIWRSTGVDSNTELDWPSGSKQGARICCVYIEIGVQGIRRAISDFLVAGL